MNTKLLLLLVSSFVLVIGCAKAPEPVNVAEWDRYQESYFKVHFSYPKGWHIVAEGAKVSAYSSPDVVEKFFDPTSKGKTGIMLLVSYERMDTHRTLEAFVDSWKNDLVNSGYTVDSTASRTIDVVPASVVEYSGQFDENTKVGAIRAVAIKDSMLYVVHYGAFNELFAPNRFLFDTLLASVRLIQPKPAAAGMEVKPSDTNIDFANSLLQVSYPDNFDITFPALKGGAEFSLQLKGYRQDCTIHIDVLPAKGLSVEKVVEQNQKFYKSTGRGGTTIDGQKAIYLNYSPAKSIQSRVYFLVKNDRVYRMIFNYYQPLKVDYLPAFEKAIASVRLK